MGRATPHLGALVGIAAFALVVVSCGGGGDATATPPPRQATPVVASSPIPSSAPTATPIVAAPTQARPTQAVPTGPTSTPAATATPRPVPTPTPTPIPQTSTPVKVLPKRGGTIRFWNTADLLTLDPTKIEAFTTFFSMDEAWSNIVQFKSDFYTQTEFIGDLADRWEVNRSGDVYTFFLNPKARWQNVPPLNGRPVTSQDVKWTFELFLNPDYGSQMRTRVDWVKEIQTPDERTLVLRLKEPTNDILFDLAWASVKVHAHELLEQKLFGTDKGIIGSGPYTFEKWEQGSVVRMKRSSNYWRDGVDGQPLPYVDGLDSVVIVDQQTQVAAARAGQIDFANLTGLAAPLIGPLRGVNGLVISPDHPMTIQVIGFQNEVKPFDNPKVRKALLKATNVRSIMGVLNASDRPLESFVYSIGGDLQYSQDRLQRTLTPDQVEAKRLLAEAGFPKGFDLEALVVFNIFPYAPVAVVIKQQWEQVGVRVSIATPPTSESNARRAKSNFQVMISPTNLQGDPVAMLRTQWKTGAGWNYYKYSNPKADTLMDQSKAEFDRARLKQILDQAQDIMWEDVPAIPVSGGVNYQVQWERVKGFKNHFAWGNQGLKFVWLDR